MRGPPRRITREGSANPAGAGAGRSFWATGRCVRARTLPLTPHGFFCDDGVSGKSRSSGGRAAPLMRERGPGGGLRTHSRGRHLPRAARSAPPAGAGAGRSFWATGRCVRARTLPLGPHGFFCGDGLSGKSRSSGGRAAPLMRERRPGRGRRCPAAWGDRAATVELFSGGRVTGPRRIGRRGHSPQGIPTGSGISPEV